MTTTINGFPAGDDQHEDIANTASTVTTEKTTDAPKKKRRRRRTKAEMAAARAAEKAKQQDLELDTSRSQTKLVLPPAVAPRVPDHVSYSASPPAPPSPAGTTGEEPGILENFVSAKLALDRNNASEEGRVAVLDSEAEAALAAITSSVCKNEDATPVRHVNTELAEGHQLIGTIFGFDVFIKKHQEAGSTATVPVGKKDSNTIVIGGVTFKLTPCNTQAPE